MKLIIPFKELLEENSYRSFLKTLYRFNKKQHASFSFQYLAKQCHFSSKSFLKDVMDGKKSLSLQSSYQLIEGLPLKGLTGKYFLALVASEEGFRTSNKKDPKNQIAELKEKLLRQLEAPRLAKEGDELFQFFHWPYVYAALGDQKKGSSFEEILEKTKLHPSAVQTTLKKLIEMKMVIPKKNRFIASSNSAFIEGLDQSEFFKKFYRQALSKLSDNVDRNFQSRDSLFYNMVFSVDPNQAPELAQELAELLDRYTEQAEKSTGDRLASLTCGFHLT